jgi:hypothetical protein
MGDNRMNDNNLLKWMCVACLLAALHAPAAYGQTTNPVSKDTITFPDDPFLAYGQEGSAKWVKFTILLDPNNMKVCFQDSKKYLFHYTFAVKYLTPFIGMSLEQFNAVTLFRDNQKAVLGTVIFPPTSGTPPQPQFNEYGIQFVRQDPYEREQIRDLFNLVKASVTAPPDVRALYFPTYEQQAAAEKDRDWFESQGISLSSTARWTKGNTCYSQGWALGRLTFIPAGEIAAAYHSGRLWPADILLTDGVPAEVPFVAGIISLAPCTLNSHVALLASSYAVPFAFLAVPADAERAQQLVGHRIIFSAYEDQYGTPDIKLIDTNDVLDDATATQILDLKRLAPLHITPMAAYGAIGASTATLTPADSKYFGGKAANSGLLRQAIPDNSPKSVALSFDLWNAFLDQPLRSTPQLTLGPGQRMLFWADGDEEQGPTHTSFALSKSGESVALYARDGTTLLDSVNFGPQKTDVSFGRSVDGGDTWQSFTKPTPGQPNSADPGKAGHGLVINEFMAANGQTIEDPCKPGEYPDWIELYNASDSPMVLNGLYLTDDVNKPTKWQIPATTTGPTLREEIHHRLSNYDSYPPNDLQMVSTDLATIRGLFASGAAVPLDPGLRQAVLDFLTDPRYGFDPNANLRFRSSTNVEDSDDFIGAGMYDSFSGCLADDLDADTRGPCACDPNSETEHGVFDAIRQAFASFYNDNAFLERLRRSVDETQVGMALLVHHSFPNDIEMANGVATVENKGAGQNTIVTLVTQLGATSVTNPEGTAIPEEVVVEVLPSGYVKLTPASQKEQSSLLPVGRTVMEWTKDYKDLVTLLMSVSKSFGQVTGKTTYILDLEYKKMAPGGRTLPAGGLVVKQVREVPSSDRKQTPFLVDAPTQLEVYTGEFDLFDATDVFADHRLKSRWTLETRSMTLNGNNLSQGLYTKVSLEYLDEDRVHTITSEVPLLPSAEHAFDGNDAIDSWRLPELSNPRTYHLRTPEIPMSVLPTQCPVLTLADLGRRAFNVPFKCLTLDAEYEHPVTSWYQQIGDGGPSSGLRTTTRNRVRLWRHTEPSDDDIFQERTFSANGISIHTSFYNPAPPPGQTDWVADAGATAPLKRWDRTTIQGLTAEPIILEGYYSQTYRPEHHNFIENFLFEPRLEPGISQAVLGELKSKNIRFIHMVLDHRPDVNQSKIATYDFE